MPQFNVSNTSYQNRIKLVDKFLTNMMTLHQKTGLSGVLLAGDPGVGKTSFVRFFSTLLGIKLVIIESPHITEEHIINIPFIIFDPSTKQEREGSAAEDADYKIILSQSHLVSQINHVQKIPDDAYLRSIYRAPGDIQKIFESYGGDADTIPQEIQEVRDQFKCLLFLDEFYRQTSTRIRNMLRNILNGKIGTDKVPPGTYVMYASNLDDNNDAVEGIPLNHQYARTIEFKAPDKDEWFSWLVSKFENDHKVQLNKNIINTFYEILEDSDINHHDAEAEVRVSPRRWEQLLLYINASLPVKDEAAAKGLLTNVKLNFKNYLTGSHAKLATKVVDAVVKLIKETSGIEVSASHLHGDSDWRSTLEHQIELKMKLGHHRKYIPIMSGMPGVGKTFHAAAVAEHLKLCYIHIDCATLDPEDVMGIPLSKSDKDKVETRFSTPKLYKQIMDDIKAAEAELLQEMKEEQGANAVKEWKARDFKYLIFFDELNRTSSKVFNGIRRVILEKSFSDELALPEQSVIVAAINPSDRGANELTHHLRDVVDVIETGADWSQTKKYLESMNVKVNAETSKTVVLDVINRFAEKFKVKGRSEIKTEQRQFYLDVGADTVYVSPREYSDLYSNTAGMFDRVYKRIMKKSIEMTKDELRQAEQTLRETLADSFEELLKGVMHKQDVDSPEFTHNLREWFLSSPDVDLGEGIFYRKNATTDFKSIVLPYFDDPSKDLVDDAEFINYINTMDVHNFKSDLEEFIADQLKDEGRREEIIKDKKHPKKVVTIEKVEKIQEETISKFEHFFRELVQTFNVHNLSNEKRQAARESATEALKSVADVVDDDLLMDMMDIQRSFDKFMKGKVK